MSINVVSHDARGRYPIRLLDGPVIGKSPDALNVRRETDETVMVTPHLRMIEAKPGEPTVYSDWFGHRYQRVGDTPEYRYCEA